MTPSELITAAQTEDGWLVTVRAPATRATAEGRGQTRAEAIADALGTINPGPAQCYWEIGGQESC